MESKASRTDDQIPDESNEEDSVMTILNTVEHALESQGDEDQVRQCVDNLCRVRSRVVILAIWSATGEIGRAHV